MYDAVVKSLLRNKDKNGDGVIDFQVGSMHSSNFTLSTQWAMFGSDIVTTILPFDFSACHLSFSMSNGSDRSDPST